MPPSSRLSEIASNAVANGVCALLNSGFLRIYAGTHPASADVAALAVPLVEFRFSAVAFERAVRGISLSRPITSAKATADGTASWFRTFMADGRTAVFDGSVGLADADIVLSRIDIQADGTLTVNSLAYETAP